MQEVRTKKATHIAHLDRQMHVKQKGSVFLIYKSVCKKMEFEYVKKEKFKKGKDKKWPKYKAAKNKDND